jgi:NAD(P)-dependent dehydrogenase (short-subunit alcohol dehydrogenase family)
MRVDQMSEHSQQILIIGGTSGIGWALAQSYLQAGHQVTVAGRHPERLDPQALQQYRSLQYLQLDIADAAAVRAAMPRTNSGQPTVLDKLTTWRRHLARSSNLSPQEICSDADLLELSGMTPAGVEDFAPIFGDMTAQRVGPALLEILAINSGLIDTNIA